MISKLPFSKSLLLLLVSVGFSCQVFATQITVDKTLSVEDVQVSLFQKGEPVKKGKKESVSASVGMLGNMFQNFLDFIYAPDQAVSSDSSRKAKPCPKGTKCNGKK